MWKLLVGFVVFAALALFMLKKMGGGGVDMGGEKHGIETSAPVAEAASAPAMPASAALPASAASN